MNFISGGQLLIGYTLADGKTDVGNATQLADEEEEEEEAAAIGC